MDSGSNRLRNYKYNNKVDLRKLVKELSVKNKVEENLNRELDRITDKVKNLNIRELEQINEITEINLSEKPSVNLKMNNDLFNHLRIPDAVKDLPRFDGNKRTLFDFVENVEEILKVCGDLEEATYKKLLLRSIRNKIVGDANDILNMYGTPLDWDNIKLNLTTHYSDKRNETSLIKDLHGLNQGNDSVEQFYSKIIDIHSTIMNNIKLNEDSLVIIQSKKELYANMCLNCFLSGMKEPLGSIIRAMRPETLAEAFSNCLEEQNMHYLKNKNNYSQHNYQMVKKPIPNKVNTQNYSNFNNRFPINNFVRYQNPQYGYQNPQNRYQNPQYKNQNPQYKNQNPQYKNPNFNQFPQQNKPIPMDTVSAMTKYKQPAYFEKNRNQNNFNQPGPSNQFRSIGPPNFKSGDIFPIDTNMSPSNSNTNLCENQNYYPNLDEYSHNSQPIIKEIDDQDFQYEASGSQ